jgi:sugar phosphate isomerase/epimerase
MIENCDMRGWQKPGEAGTISFSPELWEEMFRRIPNKSFGLNYDPSHLIQMLMEYISPINTFADRIFHVHAKDGKALKDMVKYYGVFDKQLGKPNEFGYRKAKMPGLGDIDWKSFFKALKDIKYDYVISIEHEDMDYSSNEGQIKEGLLIAKKNIEGFIK